MSCTTKTLRCVECGGASYSQQAEDNEDAYWCNHCDIWTIWHWVPNVAG